MSVFVAHFQTQVYLTGQTVFLSPFFLPKLLSCLPHTQSLLARPFTSPGVCVPVCVAFHFQHHLYVCVRLLFSWFSCYLCSFLFFLFLFRASFSVPGYSAFSLDFVFFFARDLGLCPVGKDSGASTLTGFLLLFLSTDLESSRYPRELSPLW